MKPALVLIHGWGQTSQCWQRLHCDDAIALSLPGHDDAAQVLADGWVDALLAQLPNSPVCLVGWSLGGQIAMHMALRMPQQITSLVLLASTPCFMQRYDWPHGATPAALRSYQQGVLHSPSKLLHSFHGLMLKGGKSVELRPSSTATAEGLSAGLRLLKTWDLRHHIASISCPVWLLHGMNDGVVPLAAGYFLAEYLHHVQTSFIADASHALPWTHAPAIYAAIAQARAQ